MGTPEGHTGGEERPRHGAARRDGGDRTPAPGAGREHRAREREYRAQELATEAGITPRTLRFYRERGLLPPPRREGRIAWYDDHHLARLRTISVLLSRGHTLGGIAALLDAFEKGRTTRTAAELLGLDTGLTSSFSEETSVRLTPEDLADHFPGEVTTENFADALEIGYLAIDGDHVVHVSRRLLDASSALVREGVSLSAILAAGRALRVHADAIAGIFSDLVHSHLRAHADLADAATCLDLDTTLESLRPLAKQVAEAELGLALDRRVRAELGTWLGAGPGEPGEGPQG